MEKDRSIRQTVLDCVSQHPEGCLMEEIANELNLTTKQVTYAITFLTENGCIISDRTNHYPKKTVYATGKEITRIIPNHSQHRNRKSPNAEEIYAYLLEHPGSTINDICNNTRFCRSVVQLALNRLEWEYRVSRDDTEFNACKGMGLKWKCTGHKV